MNRFIILLLISILSISFGAGIAASVAFNTTPTELLCPTGQTVWLEGSSPAYESVLVYLNRQAVGGGSADGEGFWRVPLKTNERPGIYPIEVQSRSSRKVLARFTCFVDVPLDATPVSTDPSRPTTATTRTATTRPATTPTRTVAAATTGTTTNGTATAARTTTPRATAARTTTPTATATAGPTPTQITINDILIIGAGADERQDFPSNPGFVDIENRSAQDIVMTGWTLRNSSKTNSPIFTFPEYTLKSGEVVTVWTDTDDNTVIDLFWNLDEPVWDVGNVALLRDSQERQISNCIVTSNGTSCTVDETTYFQRDQMFVAIVPER
ncbi:MAG: lamin tail domain-containing protein [Chloroflexales bacterium]|nr:lamin tail domain-containing protein [Chloroflexales bacterium]